VRVQTFFSTTNMLDQHTKVAQFIGTSFNCSIFFASRCAPSGKSFTETLLPLPLFAGGNSIETAPVGPVSDYVKSHGGHTVITKVRFLISRLEDVLILPFSTYPKVLIANNGA
jgi:hypothetical protein